MLTSQDLVQYYTEHLPFLFSPSPGVLLTSPLLADLIFVFLESRSVLVRFPYFLYRKSKSGCWMHEWVCKSLLCKIVGSNPSPLEFSGNFSLCVNKARISFSVTCMHKMKIAAELYFYRTIYWLLNSNKSIFIFWRQENISFISCHCLSYILIINHYYNGSLPGTECTHYWKMENRKMR